MAASKAQLEMAEVFWEAANTHLLAYQPQYLHHAIQRKSEFSCDCLHFAAGTPHTTDAPLVKKLGADEMWDLHMFDEFPEGEDRQGARYLWLMFVYEGLRRGEIEL